MPGWDAALTCRALARQVRGMPATITRLMTSAGPRILSDPLADALASRYTGPYAAALTAATRPSTTAPGVDIGGHQPLVSGGATGHDLLPALTGPSRATVPVTRRTPRGRTTSYTLPTGRQFKGRAADLAAALDAADLTPALDKLTTLVCEDVLR